jgi:hypothetical protein
MTRKSPTTSGHPFASIAPFGDAVEPSLARLQSFAESNMKFVLRWSEEWARFATQRFNRDQKFLGHLAECRDWAAAAKLHATWVSDTLNDYLQEGNDLAELARRRATEAFASASGGAGDQTADRRQTGA